MKHRSQEEITAAAYDIVADAYARALPDDGYEAPLDRAMISDFADRISALGDARVIDAGCGAGRMAPLMARKGLDYVGVDGSAGMVVTAARAFPDHRFMVGDLASLPVPDATMHGVLAWYSIIHTPPAGLAGIFEEFRRVLRPGGHVLLGFQIGAGARRLQRPYGHDVDLVVQLHEPASVVRQLEEEAFTVQAVLTRAPRPIEHQAQAMILASLDHGG